MSKERMEVILRLLRVEHEAPPPLKPRKCLDLLVAFFLAQNTQPANARSGYRQLRRAFATWADVMNAPIREVQRCIAICGLARMRARRLQTALRIIQQRHGSLDLEFLRAYSPTDAYEYLTSYHGVGPKTAAATLLFAFDMPLFPVDQRMHRMCRRLRLVRLKAGLAETSRAIEAIVTERQCYPLHVLIREHAKTFCRPKNPKCRACCLLKCCPSGQLRTRHRPDEKVPARRARPVILSRFASDGLSKRKGDREESESV